MATNNEEHMGKKNPDAITGAPGSHPGGTAIGGVSGAATGAAIGSLGGPIGAIIGGVAGAIVGGGVGHEIGETVDPTDDAYWRDEYKTRPYASTSHDYDRDVAPAYRYGSTLGQTSTAGVGTTGATAGMGTTTNAVGTNRGTSAVSRGFADVEAKARQEWDKMKGKSTLTYDQARGPINDAYDRRLRSRDERQRGE